eukprot:g27391.t2
MDDGLAMLHDCVQPAEDGEITLSEFIEGAARLRGQAKALDIWRMETKVEVLFEEVLHLLRGPGISPFTDSPTSPASPTPDASAEITRHRTRGRCRCVAVRPAGGTERLGGKDSESLGAGRFGVNEERGGFLEVGFWRGGQRRDQVEGQLCRSSGPLFYGQSLCRL